jgi:hypothetical protein
MKETSELTHEAAPTSNETATAIHRADWSTGGMLPEAHQRAIVVQHRTSPRGSVVPVSELIFIPQPLHNGAIEQLPRIAGG